MFCWLWLWQWGRNWIKSWYAKGSYRPVPSSQPETWFFTWTFFWKSWKTDELVTGSSPFEWLLITYRIMPELRGLLKNTRSVIIFKKTEERGHYLISSCSWYNERYSNLLFRTHFWPKPQTSWPPFNQFIIPLRNKCLSWGWPTTFSFETVVYMGPGKNQEFLTGKAFARLWDIFLTNVSAANRSLCYVMAIQCFLCLWNLSLSVQLFTPVKQKLQWEERRYCCPYLFIYLFSFRWEFCFFRCYF